MRTITRDELKQNIDKREDFALVKVLSQDAFREFHLPGAIHVPLDDNFEERIQKSVPKDKPVVVYCKNIDCQASPTAAKKMDQLGYRNVSDYEAGKMDWKQAGMPIES